MSQVFPAHWDVLPFSLAVKDATSEYSKLQKSEYLEQGRFPIVDQGQQKFGGYTDDESVVSLDGCPAIVFGDHTRIFKFIDEPFCLGADGAKVLEPKAELDKKFLFYYLSSLNIESAGYSRHFKFLKENVVPVPPLPEQKRIAAILDKADAIRRKRQQAIQLADDILHSVFQCHSCAPLSLKPLEGSVDHRWVRLSTVARLESGHTPSRKIEEYWGGDIKWLSLKDVKSISDAYIYDTFDKPTQLGIDNSSARLLPKGTVALCRTASVGRCVILGEDMATSQDYVNWVCGKELIPEFLYATLLVSDKFFDGLKQGSTHKTIYVPVVKEFHIKLPSLGVQEKIAVALKSIVEFKLKALNEAGDLDYLFASLSQKAFAGQL